MERRETTTSMLWLVVAFVLLPWVDLAGAVALPSQAAPGAVSRTLWRGDLPEASVSVILSPPRPLLSDKIELTIDVRAHRPEVYVELPGEVVVSSPVKVARFKHTRSVLADGGCRDQFTFVLSPEDQGEASIGPLQLRLRDAMQGGITQTVEVPVLTFEVGSLLPENATTEAIERPLGLIRIGQPLAEYIVVSAIVFLFAGGVMAYWVLRRRFWQRMLAAPGLDERGAAFLDAWRQLGDDGARREAAIRAIEEVLRWMRQQLGVNDGCSEPELLALLAGSPSVPPSVATRLGQVLPVLERLKYERHFSLTREEAEELVRQCVIAAQELHADAQLRPSEAIGRRLQQAQLAQSSSSSSAFDVPGQAYPDGIGSR